MKYVGEIENDLSKRLAQHLGNIRNKREANTPLIKHFLEHGLSYLKLAGLEKNSKWTNWERKKIGTVLDFYFGNQGTIGIKFKEKLRGSTYLWMDGSTYLLDG